MADEPLRIRIPATVFDGHVPPTESAVESQLFDGHRVFTVKPGEPLLLPEASPVKKVSLKRDKEGNLYLELE